MFERSKLMPPSAATALSRDRVLAFVKLGRPRFLLGGLVLYGAGAVMAHAHLRDIDIGAYIIGQCAISATQLMTHYANDYFDVEADRQNQAATRWSGGSRVLVDGQLAPRVARDAAIVFGALAIVIDLVTLLVYRSPQTVLMLFAALFLAWGYSAPPLRLHPRGLGGFAAAMVVGALTPLIGWAMQGGLLTNDILIAVMPLAVAQFTLILVLDLPDAASDALVGKKTIAVRFGTKASARLAIGLVVVTYALIAWLTVLKTHIALAMLATFPMGVVLVYALVKDDWRKDAASLTSRAIGWFAALSTAILVGAVISTIT